MCGGAIVKVRTKSTKTLKTKSLIAGLVPLVVSSTMLWGKNGGSWEVFRGRGKGPKISESEGLTNEKFL